MAIVLNDVKSIKGEWLIKANTCVNFQGSEPLKELRRLGLYDGNDSENIKFATRTYDAETHRKFKICIAGQCLRYGIYESTKLQAPSKVEDMGVLASVVVQPDLLLRGYTFLNDNGRFNRKAAVSVSDAVETGEWRDAVTTRIHTRSGEKIEKKDRISDKSDTTLYYAENVGELTYKSNIAIDPQYLMFIPLSKDFDRQAFSNEGGVYEGIFLNELRVNFPGFEPSVKSYYRKGNYLKDSACEDGVLLSKECVDMLIKRAIKSMLNLDIFRTDGCAETISLRLTVMHGKEKTHIDLTPDNEDLIDNYVFNYRDMYIEASEEQIIKNNERRKERERRQKEYLAAQQEGSKENK